MLQFGNRIKIQSGLFVLGRLSDDADGDSLSTSALGHLAADLEQPVVSETSVLSDLLHALDVLSDLGFEQVGGGVEVATVTVVVSTVDEPFGDAEGDRVGDDLLDLLPGLLADLAGARVEVDLGDLADEVGESGADTSDRGQGECNLAFAFQVGVQNSDDVFELGGVLVNEALALFSLPSCSVDFINEGRNFKEVKLRFPL